MRKALVIAVTVGMLGALLVASPTALAAKKKKGRVFEGTYTCPCGFQVAGQGPGWRLGSGEGGFQVPVMSGESTISLEITDDSGTPVYFSITQDVDGDGTIYEYTVVEGCGKTEEPGVLEPGAPITVFVYSGTCGTGAGVATGGTFKATLSK